jgi:hypothetical protein
MSKEIASLITYFKTYIPLSKEEIEVLKERITERRIKKNSLSYRKMRYVSIIHLLSQDVLKCTV